MVLVGSLGAGEEVMLMLCVFLRGGVRGDEKMGGGWRWMGGR